MGAQYIKPVERRDILLGVKQRLQQQSCHIPHVFLRHPQLLKQLFCYWLIRIELLLYIQVKKAHIIAVHIAQPVVQLDGLLHKLPRNHNPLHPVRPELLKQMHAIGGLF